MLHDPILGTTRNCINLQQIKREMGEPPWARQVVLLDHVVATAICQPPGTINDRHVHDYDEWWVVMEGEIDWVIEGREETVHARAGDFIFVPALTFHHIFPKGDGPSIRIGMGMPGHPHLHQRPARKVNVAIT